MRMHIPKWLLRDRDEDYEYMPRSVIPIAEIPTEMAWWQKAGGEKEMENENGQQGSEGHVGAAGIDLSTVPPRNILQKAAELAEEYDIDKAKWTKLAEEASSRIKDLDREIGFLRLELATRTNDVQILQSQIEELRQENSELRALHGALHAQARHLVTQYENFHIPLPVRKRAKSVKQAVVGESTVQSEQAVERKGTEASEP